MDPATTRARLEARISALAGRHTAIEKHFRGQDGRLEADSGDVRSIIEQDQVLEGLDEAALTEITEIRSALRRLDAGTFGVCEKCGDNIAEGRLNALPHVRLCVGCA
jgi:RNA polymerase-binding transcription factor DksA